MRHVKNMLVIAALAATAIAGSWAVSLSQGPTGTGYPGGSSGDTLSTGSGSKSGSSTHTQSGTRAGSTTRTKSRTSTKSSTSGTMNSSTSARHPGSRASSTTSEETGGTVSGEKWSSSTTGAATTAYERSVLASGTHKSVSGEVIEVSCYLQLGQHGPANAAAMRDFAEHGGQVGILTNDRMLYLVFPEEYQARRDGSINAGTAMAQQMGKNVTMTGTVVVQKGVRGFFVPQSEINRFGGGAAGGGSSTNPGGGTSTPGGGGGTYEGTTPGNTPGGTTQQPGGQGGMMRDTSSTSPGTGSTNPGGSVSPGGSSTNPSGTPYPGGTQGGQPDSTGRSPSGVDSTGTRPPR